MGWIFEGTLIRSYLEIIFVLMGNFRELRRDQATPSSRKLLGSFGKSSTLR